MSAAGLSTPCAKVPLGTGPAITSKHAMLYIAYLKARWACHFAQCVFELGEDLLDGIEVRAVGWQEAHGHTRGLDGFPNAGAFVGKALAQVQLSAVHLDPALDPF